MSEVDRTPPARQDLLAAYRSHTGPSAQAQARLLAALQRSVAADAGAETGPEGHGDTDRSPETGPEGQVADSEPAAPNAPAADSPAQLLRPRLPWRVATGLLAAAAVAAGIAALAMRAGTDERLARDEDPAAAFLRADDTPDAAAPLPARSIPDELPAATGEAPVPTDELPAPAVAPEVSPPPREPARGPTTRPRRDPPREPTAPSLAAEMLRMRPAQRALAAGDPLAALAQLEHYVREFPDGRLHEEYLAMHAIARCDAGHSEGPDEAASFLRARPQSIFAERVRSACSSP